ncbi:MAG: PIG-L deacetylase family protein [Bacillota bacterium]
MVIVILTLAMMSVAPFGPIARSAGQVAASGLPAGARLLVLAPHEDDETLATGQLIAAARRQGHPVHVVFITGGDGFTRAAAAESGDRRPTTDDYLALADERRKEATRATAALGLGPEDVTFLGYPDRGLKEMLLDHWSTADPYRSAFTDSTRSPYPDILRPGAPHAGEVLLTDLEQVIAGFRPTLIAAPHAGDVHPDHWATAVFAGLAVARLEAAGRLPGPPPAILGYVVHAGPWPSPPWSAPDLPLSPPQALAGAGVTWTVRRAAPAERARKELAIASYRTQLRVSRDYLSSFARTNELLGVGRTVTAAQVGRAPAAEADWRALPVAVANPWTGAALGRGSASPDWSQARLAWDGRSLLVRLELTARPHRPTDYRFYVYLPATLVRLEVRLRTGGGPASAVLTDLDRGSSRSLPASGGPDGRSVWTSLDLPNAPFPFYAGFEGPEGTPEVEPATWSLVNAPRTVSSSSFSCSANPGPRRE